MLNHAQDRGLAVGAVVSTGNEVDLGWADYVDYLLDQPVTRVVLSFVEPFRQPGRLVEVARKAARLGKPMVIAKIGRTEAGRRAAASHTASLVGTDAAYSAAFRQLGIMRVDDVDEMLDLAAYFSVGRLPAGRRHGGVDRLRRGRRLVGRRVRGARARSYPSQSRPPRPPFARSSRPTAAFATRLTSPLRRR